GMTIGEYALMINGEKWLANGIQCKLEVISIEGYAHDDLYQLPVRPSPNLPNMSSVYLYPSLCFFEGTMVSVGRGTDKPFQLFGYPGLRDGKISFIPKASASGDGPLYSGKTCSGFYVSDYGDAYVKYNKKLYLFWLLNLYSSCADKEKFFNTYFNSLAGTDQLMKQIKEGKSEVEIRATWQAGLDKFKVIRKEYLIYKDFE
ncbi:MAG TPA: exo-beta-N-acetylmuramidase NamZ domain-containing protein, partial [Bacteroidia bacterium]